MRKYKQKFKEFKQIINAVKALPCKDCGNTFPPEAMDFDHREPSNKRFSVGTGYSYSLTSLLHEMAKCDLVCANCHRVRSRNQLKEQNN